MRYRRSGVSDCLRLSHMLLAQRWFHLSGGGAEAGGWPHRQQVDASSGARPEEPSVESVIERPRSWPCQTSGWAALVVSRDGEGVALAT